VQTAVRRTAWSREKQVTVSKKGDATQEVARGDPCTEVLRSQPDLMSPISELSTFYDRKGKVNNKRSACS
jgi:hypothetical protein